MPIRKKSSKSASEPEKGNAAGNEPEKATPAKKASKSPQKAKKATTAKKPARKPQAKAAKAPAKKKPATPAAPESEADANDPKALQRKYNALELRSTETIERLTRQVKHLQANSESTANLLEEAWAAVEQQKVRVEGADKREETLTREHQEELDKVQRALERTEVQNQVLTREIQEAREQLKKGAQSSSKEQDVRIKELEAALTREKTERESLTVDLEEVEKSLQQERARYKALHDDQRQKTQHYQSEVLKFNKLVEESKNELSRLRQQVARHESNERALVARAQAREEALTDQIEALKADSTAFTRPEDGDSSADEQLARIQAERNEALEALKALRLKEVEHKRETERLTSLIETKEQDLKAAAEQVAYFENLYKETVEAATENDKSLRDYILKMQEHMKSGDFTMPAALPAGPDPEAIAGLKEKAQHLSQQLDLTREREEKLMAQLEKMSALLGKQGKPVNKEA